MSRQSTAAQRTLTLTEELEKLEQSITLTLQEIDHNFSRAHRIVTTSILPIVENYREHSNQVWEGSEFWKQFFEASANVSLSGYEEPPPEGSEIVDDGEDEEEGGEEEEEVTVTDSAQATPSSASYASPPTAQNGAEEGDGETLTPNINQYNTSATAGDYSPSPTPKAQPMKQSKAPYTSPYSSLKRATLGDSSLSDSDGPSTPNAQKASPSTSNFQQQQQQQQQQSSPFAPPSTYRHTAHRTPAHNDVLLHRVLDKNWRIQATPHYTARLPYRGTAGGTDSQQPSPLKPSTARKAARQRQQQQQQQHRNLGNGAAADDLDSSPTAPAPELHAEIFDTPARKGGGRAGAVASAGAGAGAGERVPGISILTPAKGGSDARAGRNAATTTMTPAGKGKGRPGNLWDSDDEDEDGDMEGMGMSPPKTMQFHVPQSRLMRTPAREASKRIVEDLLLTAGMEDDDDDDGDGDGDQVGGFGGGGGGGGEEEGSPSIVKAGGGLLEEDTF